MAQDPARRKQLGAAARARAQNEFSMDRMIRGTLDAYSEVTDFETTGREIL
ncbi:MAG: hypothetical protein HQL11_05605 [Candidatus Omnitrophica bacterium]|nr:hypothetical protein [Candidatus Omnitrophota bacterium]